MENLDKLRKKIDKIDRKLSELLKMRFSTVKSIGKLKARKSIPVRQSEREDLLIGKITKICKQDRECENYLVSIFKNIFKHSRSIQDSINKNKDR